MHPYSFLYKWGSHIHRASIRVSSQDYARDDNYVASTLHTPPQPLQRVTQYPRWLGNTMNEWRGEGRGGGGGGLGLGLGLGAVSY